MIHYLAPLLMAWFIANFEPFQNTFNTMFSLLPKRLAFLNIFKGYLACFKCLTFWITLGYTSDIYVAIAFSMLAYTYSRLMSALPFSI